MTVMATRSRQDRREEVHRLARRQAGLVTTAQLCALGVTWAARCAEVAAGRLVPLGDEVDLVPAVHDLGDPLVTMWSAVLRTSPSAALGGSTALLSAGLTGWVDDVPHVYVPKSADPRKPPGVRVHETRRWSLEHAAGTGLPRAGPHVAAVQGAAWAGSLRQAALMLVMPVQQRLCTGEQVRAELLRCRRLPRGRRLRQIVDDVVDGAHSLGELDLAALGRDHGLPEPERQSVARGPRGRIYLDARWPEYRLAVEVDGIHHTWAGVAVDDALRQNEVTLGRDRVLLIPLLALRVDPDPFLLQLARGLRAGGWRG